MTEYGRRDARARQTGGSDGLHSVNGKADNQTDRAEPSTTENNSNRIGVKAGNAQVDDAARPKGGPVNGFCIGGEDRAADSGKHGQRPLEGREEAPRRFELPSQLRPLANLPQWVIWKWEKKANGKWTKPPYQAGNPSHYASTSRRETWTTYDKAVAAYLAGHGDGVGFVLTGTMIAAYDLDDVLIPKKDGTHKIYLPAKALVEECNTYTEITPSGTGLRIIGYGRGHPMDCKQKKTLPDGREVGIEVYRKAIRYITVSGQPYKGYCKELCNIDQTIDARRPAMTPQQCETYETPQFDKAKFDNDNARMKHMKSEFNHTPIATIIIKGVEVGYRSDQFQRVVNAQYRHQYTPEDIEAVLRRYPNGIAAKYLEGKDRLSKEIERSWGKAHLVEAAIQAEIASCFVPPEQAEAEWHEYLKDHPNIDAEIAEWRKQQAIEQDNCRQTVETEDGDIIDAKTGEVLSEAAKQETQDTDADAASDYITEIIALPGVIGKMANHQLASARRPQPLFALASALHVMSAIAGRHMRSPTDASLNLYGLIGGPTTCGKDNPLDFVDNVLTQSLLGSSMLHRGFFESSITIYCHLRYHPVTLCLADEFGDVIQTTNAKNAPTHALKILGHMRTLFNGRTVDAPRAESRRPPTFTVRDPLLTLFCASTIEDFYDAVGIKEVVNGFLNRFLVFFVSRVKAVTPTVSIKDIPGDIISDVRLIANMNGSRFRDAEIEGEDGRPLEPINPQRIKWETDEVRIAWEQYERDCSNMMETDKYRETFGARTPLNTIKIATLLAISQNPFDPKVSMTHLRLSKELVEASYETMVREYKQHEPATVYSEKREKIIDRIKDNGGTMERRKLTRKLQRTFDTAKAFDEAVKFLETAGRIEILIETPKRGGPSVVATAFWSSGHASPQTGVFWRLSTVTHWTAP